MEKGETVTLETTTVGSGGDQSVDAPVEPGARIDRYRIENELGSGGMGVVYAAHDPELGRRIALKLVRGNRVDALAQADLVYEARAMAKLQHPNVVRVYDVGIVDTRVFVAMELVDGMTLRSWLASERRPLRSILNAFLDAGRGLAAAHAAGLVHRDFKPENVLVGADGVARVTDFGLAQALHSDEAAAANVRAIAGTPRYMAPEQHAREAVTEAADQYAFATALWEAVAGEHAIRADGDAQLSEAKRSPQFVVPPRSRMPRWLVTLLRRALSPDPRDRFPSIADLVTHIERRRRRRTVIVVAMAAVALATASVAVTLAFSSLGDGSERELAAIVRPVGDASRAAKPSLTGVLATERLTFDDGCEEFPTLSPDGARTIYDDARGTDFVLDSIDRDRKRRQLTSGPGWDIAPTISPDGKHVAFLRKRGAYYEAMVTDIDFAGELRHITKGSMRPAWSPDGRFLWAGRGVTPTRFNAETGVVDRKLEVTEGLHVLVPLEMADGTLLGVMLKPSENSMPVGIAKFGPAGEMSWLYEGEVDEVLARAPGGDGVIVSAVAHNLLRELVYLPIAGGSPVSLHAPDVDARKGFAATADWSRVVWSDCMEHTEINAVQSIGGDYRFSQISGGTWADIEPTAIADQSQLVVISDRSREIRPWVIDLTGRISPRMLVDIEIARVAVSPDGKIVVYEIDGGGLWRVPIEGGTPVKLVDTKEPAFPSVGPDGRVFFQQGDSETRQVYTVPLAGGARSELLPAPSWAPAASPVGDALVYAKNLVLVIRRGTREKPLSSALPKGAWSSVRFSADGKRVVAQVSQGDVFVVDVATGKVLDHVTGHSRTFNGAALIGPKGEQLVVGSTYWTGDIWAGTPER